MACPDRCSNYGLELILVFFTVFMIIGCAITDTGGKPPESCVFTFICGVGTILILVILCLRFKQLHHYYHRTVPGMHCLNVTSLVFGLLCALGLLVVGSFQNDNVASVHFLGAFLVFGCGVIYGFLQTFISFRIYRSGLAEYMGCCTVLFRLFLCVFSTLMFIIAVGAGKLATNHHIKIENSSGTFFWELEDGGYAFHVISTVAEWLAGFSFVFFFLSFHLDFTRIKLAFAVDLKSEHYTDIIRKDSIISVDETTPLTI